MTTLVAQIIFRLFIYLLFLHLPPFLMRVNSQRKEFSPNLEGFLVQGSSQENESCSSLQTKAKNHRGVPILLKKI